MSDEEYYNMIENAKTAHPQTNTTGTEKFYVGTFGRALRLCRLRCGMTQKEIGDKLGIPYQDYQRYEYDIFIPDNERIKKIMKAFGVDPSCIMHLVLETKMKRFQTKLSSKKSVI